jgi:hypothetical protein
MSNKSEINRIKERLGRKELSGRQLFGNPVVRMPWYSIYRLRTQVALALITCGFIFSKPIYDFTIAVKKGIQFERERKKFIKQLESEEK